VSAAEGASAQEQPGVRGGAAETYVLVHGAWHGGWCWRRAADAPHAQGHRVFTPTRTGLGERKHPLSRGVTLDVFVDGAAGLVQAEELRGVIPVGHGFGGNAISGVADRMPQQAVRHLGHLDSLMLEPGRSPFGVLPPDVVAARRKPVAGQGGGAAIPPPAAFGIPGGHPEAEWAQRRCLMPHRAGGHLREPPAAGDPRSATAGPAPASPARRRSAGRWERLAGGRSGRAAGARGKSPPAATRCRRRRPSRAG
jgi:hypothetical protein